MFLYTALRTKFTQKLAEGECVATYPITLNHYAVIIKKGAKNLLLEHADDLNEFARSDGFESWYRLTEFWKKEHGSNCFPFHGTIIHWKLIPVNEWSKPKDTSGFIIQNSVEGLIKKVHCPGTKKRLVNEAHQLPRDNEGKEVANG